MASSSSGEISSDDDDEPTMKRSRIPADEGSTSVTTMSTSRGHMWRNLMEESILESAIYKADLDTNDRNVESYDFRRATEEDKDDDSTSVDNNFDSQEAFELRSAVDDDLNIFVSQNDLTQMESKTFSIKEDCQLTPAQQELKRQMRPKKKRKLKRDKSRIKVKPSDPPERVADELCRLLHEPKKHLVMKVIEVLGSKKALHLYKQTEDTEKQGGVMTLSGDRRRSPGGVFLMLLKADEDVTREQVQEIFSVDSERQNTFRRKKKAIRRNQTNSTSSTTIVTTPMETLDSELLAKKDDILRELDDATLEVDAAS